MEKEKDDQNWVVEIIDLLTKNELFSQLNSGKEELIKTFDVGAWTLLKERAMTFYSPSYLRILRRI
ncbi:hypothetical protein [Caldiplasma sukawensis]